MVNQVLMVNQVEVGTYYGILWLNVFIKIGLSSSNHAWIWELDHKEGWAPKNWNFRIAVLQKTLENPLGCKENKPVNPKGNQTWIFTGRTDAEAEASILWPPDANEELTHWKRLWCWERLRAGGEGDDRGWDGWRASLTQWTWIWANSRR